MRPDGHPVWVSDAAPAHLHDLTVARDAGVLDALYWSAPQPGLPRLADSGYEGAGHGVKVPVKHPGDGQVLASPHLACNTLHRATRCRGEPASRCPPDVGEPSRRSPSAHVASVNSSRPLSS